jgi:nucleoside-diphosphate-sugar epimerase
MGSITKNHIFISGLNKILVFGASGWLGRECISHLTSVLGSNFSPKVILIGSSNKSIQVNQQNYNIISIDNLEPQINVDLVIDLAFITQEKLDQLGEPQYIKLNMELRKKIHDFIYESKPKYVYFSSSGAADIDFINATRSNSKRVYGELKLASETELKKISKDLDFNLLINRIWSVTGSQMQDYSKYAIGNFISQALARNEIKINSSDQVLRSYIDAEDLFQVCFNELLVNKYTLLNSGGFQTTLFDLASLVLKVLGSSTTQIPNSLEKEFGDDYVSKDFKLNELANSQGLKLRSLEDQIKNTLRAINS